MSITYYNKAGSVEEVVCFTKYTKGFRLRGTTRSFPWSSHWQNTKSATMAAATGGIHYTTNDFKLLAVLKKAPFFLLSVKHGQKTCQAMVLSPPYPRRETMASIRRPIEYYNTAQMQVQDLRV